MISEKKTGYRKNFSLILTFIVLMSVLFCLSLYLAYNLSKKLI
jgi:two-component system phosphate regulon sensor histidine kinase PhoR